MRTAGACGILGVFACACVCAATASSTRAAMVSCLKTSEVAAATGISITSLEPLYEGIRVECIYGGAGKQIVVVYAVGQPYNTYLSGEKASADVKTINGIGNGAFSSVLDGQQRVNGIVTGKAEFAIQGTISVSQETALAKKVAASL